MRIPIPNLLPLIDLILVLLVFFFYAIEKMSFTGKAEVSLPKVQESLENKFESKKLIISKNSKMFYREKEILLSDFGQHFSKGDRLTIEGDKKASLEITVNVLDKLQKLGLEKINFQTLVK